MKVQTITALILGCVGSLVGSLASFPVQAEETLNATEALQKFSTEKLEQAVAARDWICATTVLDRAIADLPDSIQRGNLVAYRSQLQGLLSSGANFSNWSTVCTELSYRTEYVRYKQAEAREFVSNMNIAQQAYFVQNTAFAPSLDKMALQVPLTQSYRAATRNSQNSAFNYKIAYRGDLRSYIGAVFVTDAKKKTVQSILCESRSPGMGQFANPVYRNGRAVCGAGTREISRG